jgi:PIN domain nuclease of toxin-antitoxin system
MTNDPSLGTNARGDIAIAETVAVSAATVWELEIKRASGRLQAPADLEQQISRNRFTPLNVTFAHARAAANLPRHHADPFDRMLVAQAQLEGFTIVTRDPHIAGYSVAVLAA